MWTEKYRPSSLTEFRGHTKAVNQVREWVEDWTEHDENAVLLHGPPGTGKTALVHALANDLDRELFETNASDTRTKAAVRERLEKAATRRSLTGRDKIILIDEVDGLGRGDRGGRSLINEVVKNTKFPVIMTANDQYANGMRTLRNNATVVDLGNVHTNSIAARLRDICAEEGIAYEDGVMKTIAHRASGDLRSAINDLESLAGRGRITASDAKQLGYRETERDIFEALKIVFKTMSAETASRATDGVDEGYDDLLQWIRENIPREYGRDEDRAAAFDRLSEADVFRGRMVTRQHWSLLKYVYALMTVGVAVSKQEKYDGWTKYAYPSKIRRMGQSRAARAKRDSIGAKVGEQLHVSVSDAADMIPVLQLLFQREEWKTGIVQRLQLDEDEVDYIESF